MRFSGVGASSAGLQLPLREHHDNYGDVFVADCLNVSSGNQRDVSFFFKQACSRAVCSVCHNQS